MGKQNITSFHKIFSSRREALGKKIYAACCEGSKSSSVEHDALHRAHLFSFSKNQMGFRIKSHFPRALALVKSDFSGMTGGLLRFCIFLYRHSLSLFLGRQCRFLPTCSEYADEAIRVHGAAKGSALAFRRFCKCHPWGGSGYDPVPKKEA